MGKLLEMGVVRALANEKNLACLQKTLRTTFIYPAFLFKLIDPLKAKEYETFIAQVPETCLHILVA